MTLRIQAGNLGANTGLVIADLSFGKLLIPIRCMKST